MEPRYFDAHCHVQFPQYDADRDEVLASMEAEGVSGLIVGVDEASSSTALELVRSSGNLWASVGIHPNAVEKFTDIDVYRQLAKDPRVVAIGECGLDNYRPEDPDAAKGKQREVFEAQIALAAELKKPLMIHSRPSKGTSDAYQDLIGLLVDAKRQYGESFRGNIHFYVGGIDEARALIDLDFTLSFTAVLTFTHDYDEVVRFAPLTHILSETDSPYVAPVENRGRRNDPRAVIRVVEQIAAIRGEGLETVRVQILENARKLFSLSQAFS